MIISSVVSNNRAGLPNPNFPTGTGGDITNYLTMTITDSTVTNNQVFFVGGGIDNGGPLTIPPLPLPLTVQFLITRPPSRPPPESEAPLPLRVLLVSVTVPAIPPMP
jgi:hypothetical protein